MTRETMTRAKILIAGIGNMFWGDDAFGVEVARRLMQRKWPVGVKVVDFGIRGIDLGYALLDDYDEVILIDATQRGGALGTLYVIEPDMELDASSGENSHGVAVETHGMVPEKVLRWAKSMGSCVRSVQLIGCEAARVGSANDMIMGLSEPVQAAVEKAVRVVEQLVHEIRDENRKGIVFLK